MTIEYFIENWRNIETISNFTEQEWRKISKHKYLEEKFIEKYQNFVSWDVTFVK